MMVLPRTNNNQINLSTESFLIGLVERIDKLLLNDGYRNQSMSQEVKSLEFWRSLIAECLSTFFYVFLVCAVNISWTGSLIGHTPNWIVMSLTSGLAMVILTQCFSHISGAHVNPAVTCAYLVTRNITPLRSILYIIAQSGGAIAGAALLYGVSIPGHQGALGISLAHESLSAGQIFGVEFVLTFLIVFTIFATLDINRKSMGNDSITIGSAYMVCSLAGLPASGASFNPARALGPAFVMNKWRHHWVYWIAPITGSMLAGLIYEFIFDSRKSKNLRDTIDDIDKVCNTNEDHYDEPEVKMSSKTIMGFPLSGSSHSNSGSSSSSTHQSNTTGYSSINSAHQPVNIINTNPQSAHLQHHPPPPPQLPPHLLPHLPQQHQPNSYNTINTNTNTNNSNNNNLGLGHSLANTFQHTVITHDGLYMGNGNNNNNNNHINTSGNSHVTPLLSSSSGSSSSSSSTSSSNYHPQFKSNNNHNNNTINNNNNVNSNSYAGIYGTRASTLRHLSNRMDFNNSRNEITSRENNIINNNNCQPGKY